jgi:hypothetical protein
MPKAKATGNASFASKPEPGDESIRTKAAGKTVAFTVRMKRAQWERLHAFAAREGCSLQQLAMLGLSILLERKGLPKL